MKMYKKLCSILIGSVLMLGTVLTGCSNITNGAESGKNSTKVVNFKLGHTLAPDSHYNVMAKEFAKLVEKKSKGTIKITVFPQSQLGGEVKMIQGVRSGSMDMVVTAQAPLENTIKEYSIFDVPYLFDSIDQANKVLAGEVGKKYLDMLPQHGLVGLGFLSVAERNVFSSKPIHKVTDMHKFKVRVMQAPGYVKAYESLGAQPTPMAYSEVYLSLQQGVVDGGDTSPDQFVMDKFVEVSKYYNKTKVHYLPALLIMSKKKMDALTPEQQKIIQESSKEALQVGIDYYKKAYDEAIKTSKQKGVKIIEPDLSEFKKATEKAQNDLLTEIPNGKKLFDEIQSAKSK
ncbi:TRAP transporter substrate-binding protein [Fictibacillus enclensis]|uniref:TRAP transporter substrate-binding protein n=1 Tax=Fictibacillus enclensis TaxID=1017270 RepID=UPI0025A1273C|nr:TRAP transporter substrate-binding protein [Fictibacillus enclensis]MDM5201128.1 TRAP transporter substrate-binding protein [Fictibacillus enclensis]